MLNIVRVSWFNYLFFFSFFFQNNEGFNVKRILELKEREGVLLVTFTNYH